MRKLSFITAIAILAMIAGAFIFNGCSKQELSEQLISDNLETEMNDQDKKFQDALVQFRDKVNYIRENPDYKSDEIMNSDDAILHIETLFNATYSFSEDRYITTRTDKTTIQIDISSDDNVLLDDVVLTFDEIINIVTQYYHACDFNQKGFLLLDLERGEITNNQLEIYLRSVIGEKDGEWEPFGDNDYWWYGYLKGDCDWNNGGTDAAVKMMNAVNTNKPLVSPPPGYRFAYDTYEVIELFGHEYEDESGEKLIFYKDDELGSFSWDDKCLEPDEMNFHFDGEQEVIYTRLPYDLNKPSNWTFMECFLEGENEVNPYLNIPSIHHDNDLTYALRHLVAIGIIDPPIEL